MSFSWVDFLALAEQLLQKQDEASLRSAINRAYYAAYHEARHMADPNDEGRFSNLQGSHKAVWQCYQGKTSVHDWIAVNGDRLYKVRVQADYYTKIGKLEKISLDATDAIKTAKLILTQLQKIQGFK